MVFVIITDQPVLLLPYVLVHFCQYNKIYEIEIYFSQCWRLGRPRLRYPCIWCQVRALSVCTMVPCSHVLMWQRVEGQKGQKGPRSPLQPFYKALIHTWGQSPYINSQKLYLLLLWHWILCFNMNFGGETNIQVDPCTLWQ